MLPQDWLLRAVEFPHQDQTSFQRPHIHREGLLQHLRGLLKAEAMHYPAGFFITAVEAAAPHMVLQLAQGLYSLLAVMALPVAVGAALVAR